MPKALLKGLKLLSLPQSKEHLKALMEMVLCSFFTHLLSYLFEHVFTQKITRNVLSSIVRAQLSPTRWCKKKL